MSSLTRTLAHPFIIRGKKKTHKSTFYTLKHIIYLFIYIYMHTFISHWNCFSFRFFWRVGGEKWRSFQVWATSSWRFSSQPSLTSRWFRPSPTSPCWLFAPVKMSAPSQFTSPVPNKRYVPALLLLLLLLLMLFIFSNNFPPQTPQYFLLFLG